MSDLSPPLRGRHRLHYAWIVLAAAIVISAVSSGIRHSFGVFLDPLVEQYGWSRGSISFAYSVEFLFSVAVALAAGALADRVGVRRLTFLAAIVFSAGTVLTGTTTHLWQFYLYFGVLSGGFSAVFVLVLPVLVTRWFSRWMGMALGLVWASLGAGALVAPPVLRWLITTVGWQQTFYLSGAVSLALLLPPVYFLRNLPRDMGTTPYGASTRPLAASGQEQVSPVLTFTYVRRTPAFWHLINIHFLGCVGHAIILAHVVSMAIWAGVPAMVGATVLGIMNGVSILSRLGTSLAVEKIGGKSTLALALFLQGMPIFLLLGADQSGQFILFAFVFGPGYGAETPAFPIINQQYYGANGPLNTIFAYQMAGAMVGMALGGWLGGIIFDLTGTYTWSIVAAAGFSLISLLSIYFLPAHRPGKVILAAPSVNPSEPESDKTGNR